MSSADRLLLILHIGFAIFSLGPVTAATMSTPRYIRRGDAGVVRYLNRATRIYGLLALAIFLFGLLLAHGKFSRAWLTVSMTLFIVAIALLLIIERDQRKAVHKIEVAAAERRPAPVAPTAQAAPAETASVQGEPAEPPSRVSPAEKQAPAEASAPGPAPAPAPAPAPPPAGGIGADVAKVESGRIATLSGVVALIWIVILVLMVWNS
jgi:Ca2+/Na+ antiporter